MSLISHIVDYGARLYKTITSWFREKPRFSELVSSFGDSEIQEIENGIYSIYTDFLLSEATGKQLELYGKIVGLSRPGVSDDEYRAMLQVKVSVNISRGEIDRILEIVSNLSRASNVTYFRMYPAAYFIQYTVESDTSDRMRRVICEWVLEATVAGVDISSIDEIYNDGIESYFGFDWDGTAMGFDEGFLATRIGP